MRILGVVGRETDEVYERACVIWAMRAVQDPGGRGPTRIEMDQADIARLERREDFDDCQLATFQALHRGAGKTPGAVMTTFGNKKIEVAGMRAARRADVEHLAR